MTINVSEAIDGDTGQIITVVRKTGGAYVDGLYVEGVESSFKTIASVQQPTPDEIEKLPEGERNKDLFKFYSKKPLRATSDRDGTEADIAILNSVRYKIISAEDWNIFGHTVAIGAREQ